MRMSFRNPLLFAVGLLVILGTLTGCLPGWGPSSVEESVNTIVEVNTLSPPDWVLGTWISNSEREFEVEFTESTVIVTALGSTTNYGELFQNSDSTIADQEITSSVYAFIVEPEENATPLTVMFQQIDEVSIRHTLKINSEISLGPITLYRPGEEPTFQEPPSENPPPPEEPPADEPPPDEPPSDPVEPPPPSEPVDPPQSNPEEVREILNPPDWIQGEWQSQEEDEYQVEFNDSNLIVTALDFTLDYGELYTSNNVEILEEVTEEHYAFEVTSDDSSLAETLLFEKLDEHSIRHSIRKDGGISIGPVTLYRPGHQPTEEPPADEPPADDPPPSNPPEDPQVTGCESWQVDINSATAQELRAITHIDEARAAEIIELRPFESVDDLERVSGIAETRLQDIIAQNVACVADDPSPSDPPDDPEDPACEGWQVDINNAPRDRIISIIHIWETYADELISKRPYSSIDDLSRISGVGDVELEDIKHQGVACVTT